MDDQPPKILNYYSSLNEQRRPYLSKIAVAFSVCGMAFSCCTIAGIPFALAGLVMGIVAMKKIDREKEQFAYNRAYGAIVLASLDLLMMGLIWLLPMLR